MDGVETVEYGLLDADEIELRQKREATHPVVTAGTLIFSIAFCALVFWARWKEASLFEKCGWHNEGHCRGVVALPSIGKMRTSLAQ
jgi:hypothetical protein